MDIDVSALKALVLIGVMFAVVAIGWLGWTRYRAIMEEAERLADRSVCPACATYGRFFVARVPRGTTMEVRCRKCGTNIEIPQRRETPAEPVPAPADGDQPPQAPAKKSA